MVGLVKQRRNLWVDEIAITANVYALEGWYAVSVLKPSVNDGNHHALTTQSDVVQSVAMYRVDLLCCSAIDFASHAVMVFEAVTVLLPCQRRDGVGSLPH